jgi:hypothetical protein
VDECKILPDGAYFIDRDGALFGHILSYLRDPGRAVRVDPIKLTLKAPGTNRLKLR